MQLLTRVIDLEQRLSRAQTKILKLQQKLDFKSQALDLSGDAVILINTRGIIVSARSTVKQTLGYSPRDLIGCNINMLMDPEVAQHHDRYIREYLKTGEGSIIGRGRRVQVLHQNGEHLDMYLKVTPVERCGRKYFLGIMHCLDDVVQKEKELLRANQALDQVLAQQKLFFSAMAHDLRNPLYSISGLAEILSDMDLGEIPMEHLGLIQHVSEHMLHIVNNLLFLAKLDQPSQIKINRQPVNLIDRIVKYEKIFHSQLKAKNLKIVLKLDATLPAELLLDMDYVEEVLTNLISNAIKFTPDGGEIELGVKLATFSVPASGILPVEFYVRDTGIGIPREKLDKIFNAFTQVNDQDFVNKRGVGLGLTISQKIVEMLGGQIQVQSMPGEGSLFSFILPVEPVERAFVTDMHIAVSPFYFQIPPGIGEKPLLIIDDGAVNLEVFSRTLKVLGFKKIYQSQNGRNIVDKIKTLSAGIVFLDVHLDDENGFDLVKLIRQDATLEQPVIVIMSANDYGEMEDKFLSSGADHFISKADSFKEIREKIFRIFSLT